MSNVFQSVGVLASATSSAVSYGDPTRIDLARDAVGEVEGFGDLLLTIDESVHGSNPLVMRGLVVRLTRLAHIAFTLLDAGDIDSPTFVEMRDEVVGRHYGVKL